MISLYICLQNSNKLPLQPIDELSYSFIKDFQLSAYDYLLFLSLSLHLRFVLSFLCCLESILILFFIFLCVSFFISYSLISFLFLLVPSRSRHSLCLGSSSSASLYFMDNKRHQKMMYWWPFHF